MQDSTSGVLVSDQQPTDSARRDYERTLSQVATGQLRGTVLHNRASEGEEHGLVRKGALWGGIAGFIIGLVPLMMSVVLSTVAGALIAKASEFRIRAGLPVQIHSVHHDHNGRQS